MAEVESRKRGWVAALLLALVAAGSGAARADEAAPACQLDERFAPRQSVIYPAVTLGMAPRGRSRGRR